MIYEVIYLTAKVKGKLTNGTSNSERDHQAFFQFNDEYFNSRSPLLTSSTRAPYGNKIEGFNLTGPIKANKASFGFDFERRDITENAFVNAAPAA